MGQGSIFERHFFSFWFWRIEVRKVPHLPISAFGSTQAQQLVDMNWEPIQGKEAWCLYASHWRTGNLLREEQKVLVTFPSALWWAASDQRWPHHHTVMCLSITPPGPAVFSALLNQREQWTQWETMKYEGLSQGCSSPLLPEHPASLTS